MAEQELARMQALGQAEGTPAITILIVNRNSAAYLAACLQSLVETHGDISVELLLIDGSSTDESVAVAQGLWPSVKVTTVPEDLGYVRANNVGLKQARGRYTMYLNSDTVIYPGALQELIRFLDAHPEVGAASGSILNPDGSDQGVVRHFPTIMNGIFGRRSWLSRWFPKNRWYRQYMQSRQEQGLEPFRTEILSACSLVVRTDLAQAIGGMDERFRFYWVDAQLCGRIERQGHQIFCVPRARIMHHEGKGGSTGTFAKRLSMNKAFHDGAYLAYVEHYQLGTFHPLRLLAKGILTTRFLLLVGVQLLRPSHATSSGGKN